MTNNERIQANNAELREAIEMAEKLPDAGEGGTPTPTQEKTIDITENGTHTINPDDGYALSKVTANVNVPIPNGYIKPSGTKEITENGTHDARDYESVSVNVPIPDGYIQPSGTLDITENGTHDVTEKASVNVNVPSKEPIIQPLEITENGTYTTPNGVDGYSPITVNVASGGGESPTALLDAMLNNTITSIDSNVTSVVGYACRGLSKIKTVNLPNATSIGTYAFYYCTGMSSFNAPKVTSLGTYAFYNCNKLKSVNFPLVTSIAQNSFYSCTGLVRADFGVAGTVNQAAFAYCENLEALILRKSDAICKLATATNALQGSAIAEGTGYVYVPAALIETYKTATNWANYASQIRAIEDYPDITGG